MFQTTAMTNINQAKNLDPRTTCPRRGNNLSKLKPFLVVFVDVEQNKAANLNERFEAWPKDRKFLVVWRVFGHGVDVSARVAPTNDGVEENRQQKVTPTLFWLFFHFLS